MPAGAHLAHMTAEEAVAKYFTLTDTLALFYHGPCSQWWASTFRVDDTEYNCMEQFMMDRKSRVFGDWEAQKKIMAERGGWDGTQADFNRYPREQKRLGRSVFPFNEKVWNSVNTDLIYTGTLARWSQDKLFREVMSLVSNRILVECSPTDKVWGIGMSRTDPDALDPANWQGENRLGLVLTRVNNTVAHILEMSEPLDPGVDLGVDLPGVLPGAA